VSACPDPTDTEVPFVQNRALAEAPKVCGMLVRSINTEDRIRELCARAAATEDPDEIDEIVSQLRAELHQQITYLRSMVDMYRSCISDADSDESECA
jgi:hypothetical protein